MRLKILKILCFLLIILLYLSQNIFSQEEKEAKKVTEEEVIDIEKLTDVVSEGFKKALDEVDMEKAKKEEEINTKLDSFIEKWVNTQVLKRKSQVKNKIEQDWHFPTMPSQPIDYYLRDFSYSVQDKNIMEIDSITFPYKAIVDIKEILYVDKGPLVGMPRSEYQYTADIDIRIALYYNKSTDKWQITDVEDVSVNLEEGWPQEIKRKLPSHFLPLE